MVFILHADPMAHVEMGEKGKGIMDEKELMEMAEQAIIAIKDTLWGKKPNKTLLEDIVILRTAWQDMVDENGSPKDRMTLETFDKAVRPYVWGLVPVNGLRVAIAATRKGKGWSWWLHELSLLNTDAPEVLEVALGLVNSYPSLTGYAVGLISSSPSS